MTAILEDPPADLTADALYADEPDDAGDVPAGEDFAPYGQTFDRKTQTWRAKKRPGRPKVPPGADDLAALPLIEPEQDAPPPEHRGRFRRHKPDEPAPPMPRAKGIIADGVNKLYRRAGKVIRVLDYDIGQAVIECTRPDPEGDELTVGEAWENLAKHNPRIRRFLLKAIAGGDWSDLIMAHAPIGMAIVMKPAIAARMPRMMASFLEPDEDTQEGDLTPEDGQEMADLAESQMQRMADRVAAKLPDDMAERAKRAAERIQSKLANGLTPGAEDLADLPPELLHRVNAVRRQQPKRTTRAARRG